MLKAREALQMSDIISQLATIATPSNSIVSGGQSPLKNAFDTALKVQNEFLKPFDVSTFKDIRNSTTLKAATFEQAAKISEDRIINSAVAMGNLTKGAAITGSMFAGGINVIKNIADLPQKVQS
jgi:hypothetical protein